MANDDNVVINFVGNTSQLDSSISDVKKELVDTGKVGEKAFVQFAKTNEQVAKNMDKTTDEAKKLNNQFREITKTIADEVIKEVAVAAKEASLNFVSLRTQLFNAKEALYKLSEEGKRNSKEWNAQVSLVQKLSHDYKELNKTINNLGSTTKVFSGLLESARGVAAGFEIAKSATVLFGGESKKAEETIKQLVAIMAVLQGLQEVQNLLEKDSAAILLIENGQRLAGVAATNLQTAAESENIIVSKLATAAQWALNLAMEANPIMLLVGALGAAIAALLYFTSAEDDATEGARKLTGEQKNNEIQLEKLRIKYDEITGSITSYQAKIKIAALDTKKALDDIDEKINEEIKGGMFAKIIDALFPESAMQRAADRTIEAYKKHGLDKQQEVEKQGEIERQARFDELDRLADIEADANAKAEKMAREKYMRLNHLRDEYLANQLKGFDEADKKLREALIAEGDNTSLDADKRIEFYFLGGLKKEEIANRLATILSEAQQIAQSRLPQQRIDNSSWIKYQEDKLDISEKFNVSQKEIDEDYMKWTDEVGDTNYQNFVKWENKKLAALKASKEVSIEAEIKTVERTFQLINGVVKAFNDLSAAYQQQTLDKLAQEREADSKKLEEKFQADILAAGNNADKKKAIEKRYQIDKDRAEKEALKKEKEIKKEQAIASKASAIFNILIGLAEAIAKIQLQASVLAATPIVGAALSAQALAQIPFAIALSAVQLGVLAATPLKLAKGTEYVERNGAPAGTDTIPAMINEGERIVPTHINRQLNGVPNEVLPRLLEAYYSPMPHAPELSAMKIQVENAGIDYDKLGTIIAEKLKANPQTVLQLDKNGFTLNIIEKGNRITKYNNRYKN